MNLVIDAGNTAVKLAVFDRDKLVRLVIIPYEETISGLEKLFSSYPEISHAMLSAVGPWEFTSDQWLPASCTLVVLDAQTRLPFRLLYDTPETLGKDRIALAAAALSAYPGKNALVIDAGTCITYDLITDQKEYRGGAISPGLQMRYRALHDGTAGLPLLEPEVPEQLTGTSTSGSIHSGVVLGICYEIQGVIEEYRALFPDLTVILTGGDAQFLSKQLKNTIFAHSNFLLQGLNLLLEHNKS
ncbi:type III pantothenate kinase [Lentiprolixibacter aurantiacus]|uniref:Type III pantothenate kinase n=1 Tax=Lentiprolixibacter aurantiacus TaxID=2993939 RepID=A0AAE3MJM9_9FLAO|nr:type III pantothenate kinase [Lentiprolixibacter aurantiacus]MCX2718089.1 type III pantothenate kinase [Lentiprolixibacter aurantiacus]